MLTPLALTADGSGLNRAVEPSERRVEQLNVSDWWVSVRRQLHKRSRFLPPGEENIFWCLGLKWVGCSSGANLMVWEAPLQSKCQNAIEQDTEPQNSTLRWVFECALLVITNERAAPCQWVSGAGVWTQAWTNAELWCQVQRYIIWKQKPALRETGFSLAEPAVSFSQYLWDAPAETGSGGKCIICSAISGVDRSRRKRSDLSLLSEI